MMTKNNSLIPHKLGYWLFPQHLSILWSILGIIACISEINQLTTKLYNIIYVRHYGVRIVHTHPPNSVDALILIVLKCDLIWKKWMKCRWVCEVWPQFTVTWLPLKEGNLDTDRQTDRHRSNISWNEGRGWDNALPCKGTHRLPANLQKLGRRHGKDVPHTPQNDSTLQMWDFRILAASTRRLTDWLCWP